MARSNQKKGESSTVRKNVLGSNPFGKAPEFLSPPPTEASESREERSSFEESAALIPKPLKVNKGETASKPQAAQAHGPSSRRSKAGAKPRMPGAESAGPLEKKKVSEGKAESKREDVAEQASHLQQEPELSIPRPIERPGGDEGGVVDAARDLFSSDYYLRQWGRIGMRTRSEVVDDFGLDPTYEAKVRPLLEAMYKLYFRASTEGIEHVPSEGRALIVANHSGTLPYDSLMLKTALRLEHPAGRQLRWLAEDFVFYLPFAGSFMNRLGAVRACPENAERLLSQEKLVSVFPEGAKGTGRLYRDRHKLQRFGRGGFVRLCLKTRTPVIPCAIIGAEEGMPLLHRVEHFSKMLGLPYIPITPTFPALGALGLIPAPTRWFFHFGEPIHFDGYGPEAAEDPVLVGRLTERIRATIQNMVDKSIKSRRSVWFG